MNRTDKRGCRTPKTALSYGTDSCIAWNRCHIFTNKRGTYGIIADDLRFATQLLNVYGNAIRAKLAAAQTTRSVAGSFSSFVTQNLQCICSLYHRHPRFFHKSPEFDSMQCMNPRHSPRPMPKAVFCFPSLWQSKRKKPNFFTKNDSGKTLAEVTEKTLQDQRERRDRVYPWDWKKKKLDSKIY